MGPSRVEGSHCGTIICASEWFILHIETIWTIAWTALTAKDKWRVSAGRDGGRPPFPPGPLSKQPRRRFEARDHFGSLKMARSYVVRRFRMSWSRTPLAVLWTPVLFRPSSVRSFQPIRLFILAHFMSPI